MLIWSLFLSRFQGGLLVLALLQARHHSYHCAAGEDERRCPQGQIALIAGLGAGGGLGLGQYLEGAAGSVAVNGLHSQSVGAAGSAGVQEGRAEGEGLAGRAEGVVVLKVVDQLSAAYPNLGDGVGAYELQVLAAADDVLVALAICSSSNPKAKKALECLPRLEGCEAHCTYMLSPAEEMTLKKLKINITCQPQYLNNHLFQD